MDELEDSEEEWQSYDLPDWATGLLAEDSTFEEWLTWIFDHPVQGYGDWWRDLEPIQLQGSEQAHVFGQALSCLIRLFEDPSFLMDRFSPGQIDQGIHFIIVGSSHFSLLWCDEVPWEDRDRAFKAIPSLYQSLFAPLYEDKLSVGSRTRDPDCPTSVCYMWWDFCSVCSLDDWPEGERVNNAIFEAFEAILQLKSEACLESVLHGLGHAHLYQPARSASMIKRFLEARDDLSPKLRQYAERASRGEIL